MGNDLADRLKRGIDLDEPAIVGMVSWLLDEAIPARSKADLLIALSAKGETPLEIAIFARELRTKAVVPPIDGTWRSSHEILDVCGTGGDRLNTFNISTTVALTCAAAGVPVAKHGNRAITSQSGSADVLEALGIPVELAPEAAARSLMERHFAFFFAPRYHPSFRHIAPARKLCAEEGHRTVFNFLGPLLNPARPTAQLLGVSRPELVGRMAGTLRTLGVRSAMVVCGAVPLKGAEGDLPRMAWLDELSTLGPTRMAGYDGAKDYSEDAWLPGELPIASARLEDLVGGNAARNATILTDILEGRDRGPRRDAVQLNAAAALTVAGVSRSIADGWKKVGDVLDSGLGGRKLEELRRPL